MIYICIASTVEPHYKGTQKQQQQQKQQQTSESGQPFYKGQDLCSECDLGREIPLYTQIEDVEERIGCGVITAAHDIILTSWWECQSCRNM